MKKIVQLAATAALALLVHVAAPGAAHAAAATGTAHYCLDYNEGGMDCSFASLAQCNATADGMGAECAIDPADLPRRMPHAFR
jgi:uncharacterized protein DUF3551